MQIYFCYDKICVRHCKITFCYNVRSRLIDFKENELKKGNCDGTILHKNNMINHCAKKDYAKI